MKKLLLTTAILSLLASSAAYAEVNLNVDIGVPGVVEEAPAAVYVTAPAPAVIVHPWLAPSYDPHHRAHDWKYWQDRKARDRHDHRDDHRYDHR